MKVSPSGSPGVGCALVVEHLQECIAGMFFHGSAQDKLQEWVTLVVTWQLFVTWNEEFLGTKGKQMKKPFPPHTEILAFCSLFF